MWHILLTCYLSLKTPCFTSYFTLKKAPNAKRVIIILLFVINNKAKVYHFQWTHYQWLLLCNCCLLPHILYLSLDAVQSPTGPAPLYATWAGLLRHLYSAHKQHTLLVLTCTEGLCDEKSKYHVCQTTDTLHTWPVVTATVCASSSHCPQTGSSGGCIQWYCLYRF